MTGSSSSNEKKSASEKANLVFRIATVGLSLASAIMTATARSATQCLYDDAGQPTATVSYDDYPSLKYTVVANLLSAVLQGVVIYLELTGREKASKAVELIDKLVVALTSTSTALLFAVDEITSCGPPGARRGRGQRRSQSMCDQGSMFCSQLRVSSLLSLAGAVSVSGAVYTRRALVAVPTETVKPTPKTNPPTPETGTNPKPPVEIIDGPRPPPIECGCGCGGGTVPVTTPTVVPPWCQCPWAPTIPCHCHNPEPCMAFFYNDWLR